VTSVEALNYLQSALHSDQTYAVVTQNPDGTLSISVDIGPGSADLFIDPLEGPEGPAGTASFPLLPQTEIYTNTDVLDELTAVLTNTAADIGKYWIIAQFNGDACISSAAYIWYGTQFRQLPFGTQGPPGTYPVIKPYVELLEPDETSQINPDVPGAGTAADPYLMTTELSIPQGPAGRCAPLASMPDFAATTPVIGDLITATGETISHGGHALPLWAPSNVDDPVVQCYTIPQAAFSSYVGIDFASTVTIASFTVPGNPWPWKPIVMGQIEMFEAELSLNPLQIGVEVLLGDPETGTLVARGFGNSLGGVVTLMPHTSSPGSPETAMTPWNSVGLVDANVSGPAATLYVNLVNDGFAAIFDFNTNGAQLFVMACPATTEVQLGRQIYGSLTTKVTLSGIVEGEGS
jgi:hypothetical protein